MLFNPQLGDKRVPAFAKGYMSESEHNSKTGVRTHIEAAVQHRKSILFHKLI